MNELAAYTLQSALLLSVGLALPALFRLRDARVRLAWLYGLLAAILLLPLIQPESGMPVFSQEIRVAASFLPEAVPVLASTEAARLLIPVLVLGAIVRLAWLGIGLAALRRWSREARPAAPGPDVERIVARVGVEARLLESDRVASPVTFGWRRPVVLLPKDLPEEARPGVVCHELVHVRRRDWLFALFEEGVRALLWFHPGVWMLLARIVLCREQVVDREAVRLTGSRRAYLEALRSVACRSWQPTPMTPGLPFFHRGHLRERVAHLCKEVSMSRSRTATLVTASAGLLALTAVLAILVFPMSGTAWAKPMKVEGNVQPPKALSTTAPVYPEKAKTAKIEGISVIETVIDATGRVTKPKIKATSGDKDLDQAAIDAVSQWTFKPATLDGKPVEVYYTLTIRFALS